MNAFLKMVVLLSICAQAWRRKWRWKKFTLQPMCSNRARYRWDDEFMS